jgi:hypothetical protein
MASVSNIVELLFKVSDQASGPVKGIESSMNGLKTSALAASAAAAAVGAGVVYAAKKAIDLGSKFEDTSLTIAGTLKAFDLASNIENAERLSVKALENIDRMAAKLPGTTEDYIEVFQMGLPAAIASGLTDLEKIEDFTSRFAAVATANMVDATQAGGDLARMLEGTAGMEVAMWRKLKPLIGMTAEQFNKLTQAQRRLAIDKSLANFSGMLTRAGNTFGSKAGEAQAHLVSLVRLGTEPIFKLAVEQLGVFNHWLTENKQRLVEIVRLVSDELTAALVKVVPVAGRLFDSALAALPKLLETMQWLIDHAEGIETAMKAAVGIWLATSTFNGIKAVLKLFEAMAAAALVIEGAAVTGAAGAAGAGGATGVGGLSGGALVGGIAMSIAKALTTAGSLAAGAFAYTLHGTLSEEVDMKEHFKAYLAGNEAALKTLHRTGVEDWNQAVAQKALTPKGPAKTEVNFHNARFDIKQNFAEGYDPDRIAVAFVDQIGAATAFRGSSGFAGMTGSGN